MDAEDTETSTAYFPFGKNGCGGFVFWGNVLFNFWERIPHSADFCPSPA